MKEHTSQGLSRRLWDAGFRGEHTHYYAGKHHTLMQEGVDYSHGFKKIPAYTFTELWGVLPEREKLNASGWLISGDLNGHSPADSAGYQVEWLIDNGHITLFTMEGTPHEQ